MEEDWKFLEVGTVIMDSSEQISAVAEAVINEFVKAMEKDGDSEEGLKKAFQVLSKDQNSAPVSADVLCRVMQNRGVTLTIGEVEETIRQVKAKTKDEGQINYEEFIKIMKLLKEPTVVDQLTKIYRYLDKEEAIVLYGESGVGKTWMARKIADHAIRRRKFDFALWIYLNRIYEGLSLQESIAYQLSILSASDESEAKEGKKEELEQDKAKQGKLEKMKEKEKQEKVESMIHAAMKGKSLLLILDDEGSKMKIHVALEEKKLLLILNDEGSEGEKDKPEVINLYQLLALDQLKSWKFLITSRNRATSGEIGVMVMPLIQDESKSLVLQKMVGVDKLDEIKDLADFFIGKSRRLPAEVLIIAKTMSYFGRSEQGLQKLQSFKEILEEEESVKMEQAHDINEYCNVTQLLISGYERLPRSVLIDCYSSETPLRHFLHQRGMVNFNELISYWIMEGHLGHRIEDAYEEGHRVLMDLVDCGLLKKLEAGYVMSSGAKFNLDIHDCYKFFESIHLGLATTFDNKLGAIGLADGMIRTIGSGQEGKKLLTLLLDGNHTGEIPDGLFESESELEILAIFNPTRKHFPLPIFKMQKLRLLVLRGCEFLESIEKFFQLRNPENPKVPEESQSLPPTRISDPSPSRSPGLVTPNILLQKLTVFEISGPSATKVEEFLDPSLEGLQSIVVLDVSRTAIRRLPSNIGNPRYLYLSVAPGSKNYPHRRLSKVEVLDLSGLEELPALEILDHSGTTLKPSPSFHPDCNPVSESTRLQHEQPNMDTQGDGAEKSNLPQKVWISATGAFLIGKAKQMLMKRRLVSLIKVMKACWIERCNELEHVIGSEEVEDTAKPGESAKTKGNLGKNAANNLKNLEILWVSDATKLRSISSGDIQSISFKKPQKLGTLFTDDSAKLEKLTALHRVGLPELKKIASKVQSLRTLRVGECPMLEHVISSTPGHEHDEVEAMKNLRFSKSSFVDKLKTIFESQHEDVAVWATRTAENRIHSTISGHSESWRVPLLEIVVDSVGLPKNLKFLEVKSCDKLKTIIQGGESELPKVDKMDLLCLPELKSIGAHLPKQENCIIGGCPKLQFPSGRRTYGILSDS
ncbi:hypothetical protein Pfo_028214 [Paulownia fortunei]|nr:hypothetical protein Pfo_028214 [Paulownia fortunei]